MTTEEIFKEALGLPLEKRELLAEALFLSIDSSLFDEVEHLWTEEAEQKLAQYFNGEVKTYDGPEVLKKMRNSKTL